MVVLDTDPRPSPSVGAPSCLQLVAGELHAYLDRPGDEGFADVTLRVEGRPIRAHRLVLSMASPRFRAMFDRSRGAEFVESKMSEIEIQEWSYEVFRVMLDYIYGGTYPPCVRPGSNTE